MKYLIKILSSIPQDKLLHFIICGILAFFLYITIVPLVGTIVSFILTNIVVIGIGYYKEKYDDRDSTQNVFDKYDLLADIIGSIFGSICASL